jgi:hypothetical protein
MYFNLSGIVRDGKIIDGSHDNAVLIRTATISQKNKVMTLTFHRNITQQDVSISITVEFNKTQEETVFNLTAGTYVLPTTLNITSNSTQSNHATRTVAIQPLTSPLTEVQGDLSLAHTPGIPTEEKPKAILAPQAEPPSQDARNQEQVGIPPSTKVHDTVAEPVVAFSTDPSAVFAGGLSEPEVEQPSNQRPVVAKANAVEPQLQQGHGEGNEGVSNASGQRKLLTVEEMGQNVLKGNGSEVLKKKLRTTRIITKIRRRKSSSSSSSKGLGTTTTNQRRKNIGINNSTRTVLTWREMTSLKQEFLKQEMVDMMVEEYREWYTQMKLQKQKWIEEEDARRKAMKTLEVPEEEGVYPWEADKYLITSGSHERDPAVAKHFSRRKLLDLFGDSLKFVDRLYSRTFGSAARKVPAHMPHMIDKNKMAELQSRWPDLWDATSSHQFRASNDMQYAFSYMYFIIHQKREFDIQTHWTEDLDVDHDG